jgi:hypothetical protein
MSADIAEFSANISKSYASKLLNNQLIFTNPLSEIAEFSANTHKPHTPRSLSLLLSQVTPTGIAESPAGIQKSYAPRQTHLQTIISAIGKSSAHVYRS